ncbi:GNAT family N-acetyltransferase [Streptomyces abyssomicinicus]|uniref:GNAT family N-acetyltransferase n=1 Tax=Streptomyces abyssomicinicus TaxID=574929 RepID=UPI0012508CE5|nr:GNAT family N-acetyltransferase [Streptomyces abyssomicinicus]
MGMSVTISRAAEQDAEQIFRLRYLCFQSEAALYGDHRIGPLTESLADVRDRITAGIVCVARLGEEVIGAVYGRATADGSGEIDGLCVHPRLQGHGIGARLLRAAEAALTEAVPVAAFRLSAGVRSEPGLRLYRSLGYEATGRADGPDGIPRIVLERTTAVAAQGPAAQDPDAGTAVYAATA